MGVARQLYDLQEIDQEIDSTERALNEALGQLGESQAVVAARAGIASDQRKLDDIKRQQRSAETDAEDLTAKIKAGDEKLYSGKVRNPKELTDLQRDVAGLKARRSDLESKALEMMEQAEAAQARLTKARADLETLEKAAGASQRALKAEVEHLKKLLADLKLRRGPIVQSIDPRIMQLYEKLRKEKRVALARVEQGICRGCRISLSSNEIQQARSGNVVQCSSCGRILFLP